MGMTHRTTCRMCGGSRLFTVLDLGDMPLAGGFLTPDKFDLEQRYPLKVSVCLDCALVQCLNIIDPDMLFRHYFYLSSVTGTLSRHFRDLAVLLVKEFRPSFVVEIGCNDGVLLKPLQQLGVTALGVDPAQNIAVIAAEKGLNVIPEYFTEDIARRIVDEYGRADIISASNVFAHIDDLDEVMRGVKILLADDGIFIVETRYIVDMLTGMQFDTIYHEHLSYYSVHSLERFFGRHGFEIVRVDRIPMHGGAIRAFVQRKAWHTPPYWGELLPIEEELKVDRPYTYIEFGDQVRAYREQLRGMLAEREAQHTLCGYGAAGRATILLNYCGVKPLYMVDESPLRAGQCMPGIHTPIYFPEHFRKQPTDDCLITAWTYEQEIIRKEPDYRGTFIVPLPTIRTRQA